MLKTTEYFPAKGNHENRSRFYFDTFPNINYKEWYAFDREGIHFIVLDSSSDLQPGSPQYTWLLKVLKRKNREVKFKIVIFHHPIFTLGGGNQDEKIIGPILIPLFKKYGVSAVFSGHSHNYQRFLYAGIPYVVTGGGGATLQDFVRDSVYIQSFSKAYHFCLITPGKDVLKVKVFDVNLRLLDEFEILPRSFPLDESPAIQ